MAYVNRADERSCCGDTEKNRPFPERDQRAAPDGGRDARVLITGSQYPVAAPEKVKKEMDRLFEWVRKERGKYHPVESAAQFHKRFVFIHPFKDGNATLRHRKKVA